MSIRRNLIAFLVLFIALGGTSYAATHRAASRGCYPRGSRTIAQDKTGRFYLRGPYGSRNLYVCAFKQGKSWELSYRRVRTTTMSATVAGRYLAFFDYKGAPGDALPWSGRVRVVDMVTGRETFTGAVSAGTTPPAQAASFPKGLVLKSNGSVAWIYRAADSTTVHRHDSTGTAIVDSGSGIDPNSLAVGGSWLYWTNDGSPRSAQFH